MQTFLINLFLPILWLPYLILVSPTVLPAQTFATVYTFSGGLPNSLGFYTNSAGAYPFAELILSGQTLYGTAGGGGPLANGTVFAINADGTGFRNLYSFSPSSANSSGVYTNDDGLAPSCSLVLSGNTLYGTARGGGTWGNGTVFKLNVDSMAFKKIYVFTSTNNPSLTNIDGARPNAGLVLSGTTVYGTASGGGVWGNGTLFAINTDGTGFTNLHNFTGPRLTRFNLAITNTDGANPSALVLYDNTLYGTASSGGRYGNGTVFAIKADGSSFTNLHDFRPVSDAAHFFTNSDGSNPQAGLIVSGNTLYGTAAQGGSTGAGTVFKLNTDGTGFTTIYNFNGFSNDGYPISRDPTSPQARLLLSGTILYGTTVYGGTSGNGTAFKVNTDGTGFMNLHSFPFGDNDLSSPFGAYTNSDGSAPRAGLTLSGNVVYGTTPWGGKDGLGTIFSISIAPKLTIIPFESYMILSWPTNLDPFILQSTERLGSSAAWTAKSSLRVVIGGQNVVVDTTTNRQQFYRLMQ